MNHSVEINGIKVDAAYSDMVNVRLWVDGDSNFVM